MDSYSGPIEVHLWNEVLGWLDYDINRHVSFFEMNPKCTWANAAAPFLMSVYKNTDGNFGPFSNARGDDWFQGIPPMIADSLPDHFGNMVLAEYLDKIGKKDELNIPMQLAYIGERGLGALEFKPTLIKQENQIEVELAKLSELSNQVAESYLPEDITAELLHNLFLVGTTAGGARSKAVVSINRQTNKLVAGDKMDQGFVPVIIKFDKMIRGTSETLQVGIIEMVYYDMARKAGINMTESWLIENEGYYHFCTKRFDRDQEQGKLHMQTYAALTCRSPLELHRSEDVFKTMTKLGLLQDDLKQEFRRMCFSYMMCNGDRHTKNISFLMDKNGRWKPTPEYDVTFPFEMHRPWPRPNSLSINNKVKDITADDFLTLAKNIGVKSAGSIINEIADVVDTFYQYAAKYSLKEDYKNNVQKLLKPIRVFDKEQNKPKGVR
ncbi:MAG: serine/threonine-protein kinase HipA [Parvicellaceae bacterium]|jgi:serine/threonine-protein kinase HipA